MANFAARLGSIAIGLFAAGFTPEASAGGPAEVLGWTELPDTRIDDVCACTQGFPEVCAVLQCAGITAAWNSAVMDTARNRLVIWGGGHNDYYGNELYALDLQTFTMERLTDPGLPLALCTGATANGTQASSRHTADAIVYMEHADRMFVFGGAIACSSGGFSGDTWTYDFASQAWIEHSPSGPTPDALAAITGYDPNGQRVLLHDNNRLFSYSLQDDAYTELSQSSVDWHATGVVDPVREDFWIIGSGQAIRYDIGAGSDHAQQALVTTGDQDVVARNMPGVAYDPVSDAIVGWADGGDVFSLDLDTLAWTRHPTEGDPGPHALDNGTFKRWSYSVALNAFAVVNATDQNAYVYRLTRGLGPQPPGGSEDGGSDDGESDSGESDSGAGDSSEDDGDAESADGLDGNGNDEDGGPGGGSSGPDPVADATSGDSGGAADGDASGCSCRNGSTPPPLPLALVLAFLIGPRRRAIPASARR